MKALPKADRILELDVLKGVAILWVFAIHADLMSGTLLFRYGINRAVPIFLVLFGYTSTLWWMKHSSGTLAARLSLWYRSRFVRLLVPVWATILIWWAAQVIISSPPDLNEYAKLVASLAGYMPWIGTGWFVTLILQLVLVFPLLLFATLQLGPVPSLLLAGIATGLSHEEVFNVIRSMRVLLFDSAPKGGLGPFYYFWIFPPAHFWQVVGGCVLARWPIYDRNLWRALAALTWILLVAAVIATPTHSLRGAALIAYADLPLCVLLLNLARWGTRAWAGGGRLLGWFGRHSWGLFLGQLLVHNALQSAFVTDIWQPQEPQLLSAARLVTLCIGAVVLVRVGAYARSLLGVDRLESWLVCGRDQRPWGNSSWE